MLMRVKDSPEPPPAKARVPGVFALDASGEARVRRLFDALAHGGEVRMPLGKTFFSPAFGMVADCFGAPWMVIVPG